MSIVRALARPALAAVASAGVYAALRAGGPGLGSRWERTNHAGRTVTLLEGPAFVAGAALASVLPVGPRTGGPRPRAAALVAVLGSGAFGALDDLAGSGSAKGLRGHVGSALSGQITTGLVKIVGLGLTGLLAAGLADPAVRHGRHHRAGAGGMPRALLGGALIAGSANIANLLDLRPGRALKGVILASAPMALSGGAAGAGARCASAAAGAAVGVLSPDLRGEAMLGDTGANAAGAMVGLALHQRLGPAGRAAAVGVVVALTLASERVSFTRVIEATPVLRELDAWGRAPGPRSWP